MRIIVVAFGPLPTTKRAVGRAGRLGLSREPIVVVPAAPAIRIGRGMIPNADIRSGSGSSEIRSLLADLGDEPVLLLHDDVALNPRGARGMATAFDGTNLVVPYTNERDTGQFIGSLPPSQNASTQLDRAVSQIETRRIEEARLGCILGPAMLLRHAAGSLVIPGSSVQSTTAELTIAPVAAAHDLSCNQRVLDLAASSDKPLLVATMIVKNEEERLPAALESLAGLVDRIEVCDTGSDDETIEIARSFGANVREIGWRDDFAWARNRALETCTDADYIIFIDADERVACDDPSLFRQWLTAWRHELDGINVQIHSSRGENGAATNHLAMRLAKAELVRFEGALHENLKWIESALMHPPVVSWYRGLTLDHDGYRPEVIEGRGKAERNVTIAKAAFDREQSMKTRLDYARSLRMIDEADSEAERLFRTTLDDLDDTTPAQVRAFVRATVAAYENQAGRFEEGVALALAALEDIPGEGVALASLGHALTHLGRFDELVEHSRRLEHLPRGRAMFSIERNRHRYNGFVALALGATGEIPEAIERATEALTADATATGDLVGPLVPVLVEAGISDESLAALVTLDEGGHIINQLSRTVPPARTAVICTAALTGGTMQPAVFVTGLTAALVSDSPDDIVDAIASFSSLAEANTVLAIADLATRRGRHDFAERLRAAGRRQALAAVRFPAAVG